MLEANKIILIKRTKTLLWHIADIAIIAIIDAGATSIGLFNLPPYMIVILGEVLAQITKQYNSYRKAEKNTPDIPSGAEA